jgi:hypothetical protein
MLPLFIRGVEVFVEEKLKLCDSFILLSKLLSFDGVEVNMEDTLESCDTSPAPDMSSLSTV